MADITCGYNFVCDCCGKQYTNEIKIHITSKRQGNGYDAKKDLYFDKEYCQSCWDKFDSMLYESGYK